MKDHQVNVGIGAKVIVTIIAWLFMTGLFVVVAVVLHAVYCLMVGQPIMSAWNPRAALCVLIMAPIAAGICFIAIDAATRE